MILAINPDCSSLNNCTGHGFCSANNQCTCNSGNFFKKKL